jgi:hypothetical protein
MMALPAPPRLAVAHPKQFIPVLEIHTIALQLFHNIVPMRFVNNASKAMRFLEFRRNASCLKRPREAVSGSIPNIQTLNV